MALASPICIVNYIIAFWASLISNRGNTNIDSVLLLSMSSSSFISYFLIILYYNWSNILFIAIIYVIIECLIFGVLRIAFGGFKSIKYKREQT